MSSNAVDLARAQHAAFQVEAERERAAHRAAAALRWRRRAVRLEQRAGRAAVRAERAAARARLAVARAL